jgi:hypothetical protein
MGEQVIREGFGVGGYGRGGNLDRQWKRRRRRGGGKLGKITERFPCFITFKFFGLGLEVGAAIGYSPIHLRDRYGTVFFAVTTNDDKHGSMTTTRCGGVNCWPDFRMDHSETMNP